MKRIVNGLMYDTEKADLISTSGDYIINECLYRTKNGRYFLYKYIGGSEFLQPLNLIEVFQWLSDHDPDTALELFPDKIKEA
ncbi:MAG: hypothetical protein N2V71_07695 [Methanophagales archaeon]|nr:hypothetical protein [Methanophagales archaeon]